MSKTLRERLLAGEHHGCATWAEVARKLGVDDRRMRVVRKTLAADGHVVELRQSRDQKPLTRRNLDQGLLDVRDLDQKPPDFLTNEEQGKVAAVFGAPSLNASTPVYSNLGYTPPKEPAYNVPSSGTEIPIGTAQCTPDVNNASQSTKWPSVEAFDAEQPVIPIGHSINGVSSYIVDGEVRGQWVKTTAQNDERAAWLEAIRDIGEALPRLDPVSPPVHADDDLLAVYPVGDPHVGLLSWHEDAGENFDLAIAEQQLVGAFQHLTSLAPSASEALLIFIGDNQHADGQSNTTTKGTRVDVDGRFVKVARTSIRAGRRAVDLALQKHKRVRLIWERGNHDELASAMTALAFSFIYENEPRVTVDVSPEMFHWFRFGKNLIGTHHGDKVKPMDLLGVMAVDRQQDWGETTHRRFYLGHYHHQMVKEVPGLICEYLPTLASSDAWHRSMGYRASKAMYMDVLHREWGHINRHIVGVQQLRAA